MEYLIIAFKSRAHSVRFDRELRARGINSALINTPKEAGVGCGLSVKIDINNFYYAKSLIQSLGLNSYIGVFSVKTSANKSFIKRIM